MIYSQRIAQQQETTRDKRQAIPGNQSSLFDPLIPLCHRIALKWLKMALNVVIMYIL